MATSKDIEKNTDTVSYSNDLIEPEDDETMTFLPRTDGQNENLNKTHIEPHFGSAEIVRLVDTLGFFSLYNRHTQLVITIFIISFLLLNFLFFPHFTYWNSSYCLRVSVSNFLTEVSFFSIFFSSLFITEILSLVLVMD